MKFDNVWMIPKVLKEHDFSESSLGICLISESVKNFLDRHNFSSPSVDGFPNNSIGLEIYKLILFFFVVVGFLFLI